MTNEERAYIAGFFDGEGNVTIRRIGGKPEPRAAIRISNTNQEILEWMQSLIGGSIYSHSKLGNRKTGYDLTFHSAELIGRFLTEIGPFVKLKAKQIKLLDLFYATKGTRTFETTDNIISVINNLNKRGIE